MPTYKEIYTFEIAYRKGNAVRTDSVEATDHLLDDKGFVHFYKRHTDGSSEQVASYRAEGVIKIGRQGEVKEEDKQGTASF